MIVRNLHPEMLPELGAVAAEPGLPFDAVDLPRMREAEVILTITSSPAASLVADQILPGTHLSCLGTNTKAKQEVEPARVAGASVFTDDVAQSITIGEAQRAVGAGLPDASAIMPLGDGLIGKHPGRRSGEEITLFDGTGWDCRTWPWRLSRCNGRKSGASGSR